ncbi:MAG: ABC transporter permease subunit, partial [Merismopedia sp. SIO2A8]|nr:ABC transporter permease subunit [Merismopedia sp. SIO2A8]
MLPTQQGRTWTGYIIGAVYLLIDGLFFNTMAMGGGEKLSASVLGTFFFYTAGLGAIASIFLSMRLIAEERQSGTMVLLASSPIKDWEIVVGKYLSALVFLAILTLGTLYMPAMI